MAVSQRGNKPKAPNIRMPWERHEVGIAFDPDECRTHQSFKDECDINNIIDLYARTGLVNHHASGKPQYVDNPETTLFEAALAQAEIRSAIEEGWEPSAEDLPEEGQLDTSSENVAQEGSQEPLVSQNAGQSDEEGL